jgi:hypothetical protein
LIPKTIPPSLREASKKIDPIFRAFPALKGPFSGTFVRYWGVIFYVNFLLFHPMLGSISFAEAGGVGSAGHVL